MKRTIALLSVLCLLLCACGGTDTSGTEAPETKPQGTVVIGTDDPVPQLDDVSVYVSVEGKHLPLEGLPDFVCSEAGGVYKGNKEGRYGLNTHTFANTDAAAYLTYLKALEADGWVQYSNNIIEGTNLFATYTKDGGSLYCYYINAKNRMYIVTSPDQNLEPRECDNQYEAVCKPLLTQVKLLCKKWSGGMSYLLRLSDGRFIVIDGGFNESDFYEARHLYQLMEQQNVLDKITIAAWIVTHPHRDHLATTTDFLRCYTSNDMELQQLILNFPTDDDIFDIEPENVTDTSSNYRLPTFLLTLQMLWSDLTITIAHTGQEYYFADAKIEILHTLEDFYPLSIITLSNDPVNGASVVFSLEVGGQKTLFLADCAIGASADLVNMWGSYLKTDIMQAAHHGLNGGTVELYSAADPEVVLVPMCTSYIPKMLTHQGTQWVWNNTSGRIKEVILSGWEQRTLELPYTPAADVPYFACGDNDPWGGTK